MVFGVAYLMCEIIWDRLALLLNTAANNPLHFAYMLSMEGSTQ